MTKPEQISALRERLTERTLDLLFVSAAITKGDIGIGEVPTPMFVEVMVTKRHSGEPGLQFLNYQGQVVPW